MKDKLIILWVSRDIEAAKHMGFMYARNAMLNGWWNQVDLIIWGPSAKVAAENAEVQQEFELLNLAGVKIKACIACADRYGVTEKLRTLDIEVTSMGPVLTEEIKSETSVITI